jgi:hypothetical protein
VRDLRKCVLVVFGCRCEMPKHCLDLVAADEPESHEGRRRTFSYTFYNSPETHLILAILSRQRAILENQDRGKDHRSQLLVRGNDLGETDSSPFNICRNEMTEVDPGLHGQISKVHRYCRSESDNSKTMRIQFMGSLI